AAFPLLDLRTGFSGLETLPESDVREAYEIISRDFSVGLIDPVEIVVGGPRAEIQPVVERLVAAINDSDVFLPVATAPEWSEDEQTALISANLTVASQSEAAYDAVQMLRTEIVPAAMQGVEGEVWVTGTAAFNVDFLDTVAVYTPFVFVFVLALSFLLLTLAFRSIVVPAKAIILNLLSVGAAYGLMVLVFQKGVGADLLGFQRAPTIEAWIPIFLFCVLFGLSMDYHVFLLSRIREHYDQSGRNRESVAIGLRATAKIITGAALIMVVVFGGFASGSLVTLQQVGFGLAVAILLDATIIRTVLVPATMALLGEWNWYMPSWLQWLPDLRVEGDRVPPEPSSPPMPSTGTAD
ncbi:MAG: MMPL family transporter, partial [Chloroflexota bacterium]|nr:MMPL family transporter [Chloroflexota bacterium]